MKFIRLVDTAPYDKCFVNVTRLVDTAPLVKLLIN